MAVTEAVVTICTNGFGRTFLLTWLGLCRFRNYELLTYCTIEARPNARHLVQRAPISIGRRYGTR
jgi:hypothetical protein